MQVIRRALDLMREPRRTWADIAAEGDAVRPLLTRYLPALLLPTLAIFLILAMALQGFGPQIRTTQLYRLGPDGTTMVHIGSGTSTALGGGLTALILLTLLGIAIAAMYALILSNARRFGAAPDRFAALKLLAYAWTPGLIGALLVFVPFIGILLTLAGFIGTVVLFRLGAPLLLPPVPGEEARFGRAIAARAIMLALAVPIAFIAAGSLVVPMLRP